MIHEYATVVDAYASVFISLLTVGIFIVLAYQTGTMKSDFIHRKRIDYFKMLAEYIKIDDELLDKHANMFTREFRSQVPQSVQNKIIENMHSMRFNHLD